MALIEIAIEELAKGIVLIPMIEKNDPRYPVDDPGVKEIFFGGRNPGEVFNGLNLKKYEIQGFNFRSHEKKLELINYLFKVYKEIIPKLSPLLDLGLFTKKIKAEKEYERIKENLVNSNKFIENILSAPSIST